MKTLMFVAVGTRGDVQPIVALGVALKAVGYQVIIAAGKNFQSWVESRGLTFFAMRTDIETMMNSPAGRHWADNAGKSPMVEGRAMRRMFSDHIEIIVEDLVEFCPQADVLFSNLPTFGFVEAAAEKYGKPHVRVMFSPLTPTDDPRSTMKPAWPAGRSPLNQLSGHIAIYFLHWVSRENIDLIRARFGLSPWGWRDYARAWHRVTALAGISPLITPPDPAWGEHVVTTGVWTEPDQQDWRPPADLEAFLAAGAAPVYIGFGSMPNSAPEQMTRDIIAALGRTGQRGIIHRGWASLGADNAPDTVFFSDGAPHDWLFPRMKAVIHHGGAGTTMTALRAGVPSAVVSHLGDQPYWGRRIHELGVGARPIPRTQLNADRLARAIEAMLGSPDMAVRARALSEQLRTETGIENAVAFIQQFVGK